MFVLKSPKVHVNMDALGKTCMLCVKSFLNIFYYDFRGEHGR